MNIAVRCPNCDGLSRVPADAAGRTVGCPRCGHSFPAEAEDDSPPPPAVPIARALRAAPTAVPTVYSARHAHPHRHLDHPDPPHGPMSVLVGLALLPFGIPLLWLAGPLLTGKQPVFTYMVPVAVAVATAGLSLGAVLAADWRFHTRVKGVLALVAVGYAGAALLYFLQAGWVEAIRRPWGGAEARWRTYDLEGLGCGAALPGPPKPDPADVLVGWPLKAVRYADRQRHADTFIVASGPAPAAVRAGPDDAFFGAAGPAAAAAVNGTLVSEKTLAHGGQPARDFVITLPDRATTRTVRVVRVGERAFVAAAEGAFLPADAREVQLFFREFKPPAKR